MVESLGRTPYKQSKSQGLTLYRDISAGETQWSNDLRLEVAA